MDDSEINLKVADLKILVTVNESDDQRNKHWQVLEGLKNQLDAIKSKQRSEEH